MSTPHTAAAALLRSVGLSVQCGERTLLQDISLQLNAGEVVGLSGDSGSGKSTLARALHGQLAADLRLSHGHCERHGTVALVPQEPALCLNPYRRAGQQVLDVARARQRKPVSAAQAIELLAQLGLEGERVFDAWPHQLSGGEQQRVGWALALIQQPAVLIADEPTAALDPPLQRLIVESALAWLQQRGAAVLWISHDRALLSAVCSRVLTLVAGRLAA